MLIGIDPGHGGNDPGAVGPAGTKEKDNVLVIAQKVVWYLQRAGLQTLLTRDSDKTVSLVERTNRINAAKCDLAVSIHNNSSNNKDANYNSVFIQGIGGQAEKLATCINNQIKKQVAWPNSGVKVANLHMTRETKMPACLVECGFISNAYEESRLAAEDIRDMFARAIAVGVTDYIAAKG